MSVSVDHESGFVNVLVCLSVSIYMCWLVSVRGMVVCICVLDDLCGVLGGL